MKSFLHLEKPSTDLNLESEHQVIPTRKRAGINIAELLKMAVSTLIANKLRSSLTMLGIVIGNASVIGMVGVGLGAQEYVNKEFATLGPNVMFIIPGSQQSRSTTFDIPKTLVLSDAVAIAEQVPTVKEVAPQLNGNQLITYRNRNSNSLVIGTTPSFLEVRSFEVAKGRFITKLDQSRSSKVAVLGPDLAERLFGTTNPIGQRIRIKNTSFEVVGILAAKGAFLGSNQDDTAIIPLSTMSSQIVGSRSPYGVQVSVISVTAKDNDSVSAAQFQITNLLRLRHKLVGDDDFTVRTQKDVVGILTRITGTLTIMLAAIAGISLLVGGIGVMNIMLVSVTERTQEIGLRKAIGAKEADILIQFLIESVILAAMGGVIGTGVGVGALLLIASFTPLTAVISPVAIILALGVSGGIGLFFGVVPAQRAAKLDPIVALRSV